MRSTNQKRAIIFYILLFLLLIIGALGSFLIGATNIQMQDLWAPKDHKTYLIIRDIRLPRLIVTFLVGSALAVSGAIMQAITRNALASPQVFGVNAGASLAVVTIMVLFPSVASTEMVIAAFIGAAFGGCIVYMLANIKEMSPVRLALAGMVIHLILSSFTQTLILIDENSTDSIIYWMAGGVDGARWIKVQMAWPWYILGLILAIWLSKSLTLLNMGQEVAKGLGTNVKRTQILAAISVVLLSGSSVAIAGPIGFIGLMGPHIARSLIGSSYQRLIPFTALLGGVLLVYADILSRFISYPYDTPVGIVTAIIGSPFFLFLAKKGARLETK
ncbi:FecCD family ABC transporter permease [Bacillus cereus]|uniref:Iron-siderophore ABC transporter permease n=1 Tax=Bacillus cereus TaxID=1396 RepID=A0A2A7I0F9_BACCE|nr:iron ABC transporter permease [Bacillus cereus]PEC22543.1 iron-siderophore ABC transporter permease [Bacillus cereus]